MYARSTTIQAHSESIDSGVAYIRDEVMPSLLQMEGCMGLSMLVDRSSGRCIATSSWRTEEAMRASAESVRSMRDHAAELLGGNRAQVDEWEIGVLHRDHRSREGACARCTWARIESGGTDRLVDVFKRVTLPEAEQLEGFCSASLMIDREAGIGVATVTYDDMATLERTRAQADQIRAASVDQAGVEVLEVCEFELALAHLRVPETV